MVTHIPPPSPSLSATSLLSNSSQQRTLRPPPRSSIFPPSPPSSYTYAETITPYAPSQASASTVGRRHRSSSASSRHAPSVASTSAARSSAHTRSHRRSRRGSEVDAHTEALQNAFPWFSQSGDVEIVLRDRSGRRREKRYLLHSTILAQNSKWFADEFGDAVRHPADRSTGTGSSRPGSRRGRADLTGGSSGWKYELCWEECVGPENDQVPILIPADSARSRDQTRTSSSGSSFLRSLTRTATSSNSADSSQRDADIINAYDNMLLSFYNHAPRMDTLNIATAYVECKILLQVASAYAATDAVGARCDVHLLRFQNRLWSQVAKYPTSYLKLGHMARSKAIFSEALIHVIGQWPTPRKTLLRGATRDFDRVIELIEDKVEEMEESRARVEAKLFRITLTTSRGERVGPLNSWTDWLAVSLFRQWVAENTTPAHSSILKTPASSRSDSQQRSSEAPSAPASAVGRTYRLLGAGGEAYLDHDELKKFLKKSPADYSRETLRIFERRMDELKNIASDTVKPLTRSFLELDAEGKAMPYLTCTRIEEGDLKWVWRH